MLRHVFTIETISSTGLDLHARGATRVDISIGVWRHGIAMIHQDKDGSCVSMQFELLPTGMLSTHVHAAACANTFTQRALIHETHFVPQHRCNSSDCTHSSFISFNP